LVGRNPVVEALRAAIPANALYVAIGVDSDERITESIRLAATVGWRCSRSAEANSTG